MVINDCICLSKIVQGFILFYWAAHGCTKLYMVVYGFTWLYKAVHGCTGLIHMGGINADGGEGTQ